MKKIEVPWVFPVVLVLVIGLLGTLYSRSLRDKHIAEANERAALDTTRTYLVGQNRVLSRLIHQQGIRVRDLQGALQKAFQDRRADARVIQGLSFTIDSLSRTTQKPDTVFRTPAGVVSVFTQHGPPIEGEQEVTVDSTSHVTLDTRLRVTPFEVRFGLGCDRQHTPVAAFESPAWVQVQFTQGTVDPQVCNPLPGSALPLFSIRPTFGSLVYFAGGILIGRTLFGGH